MTKLSGDILDAIAEVDAACRPIGGKEWSIYDILAQTPEQGTDIGQAMKSAMFGDGYVLSHERRLLAIALARALPEIVRLQEQIVEARRILDADPQASLVEHATTVAAELFAARAIAAQLEEIQDLSPDIAQLIDGWHQDSSWSPWDQSVRARLADWHIKWAATRERAALHGRPASPAPGETPTEDAT